MRGLPWAGRGFCLLPKVERVSGRIVTRGPDIPWRTARSMNLAPAGRRIPSESSTVRAIMIVAQGRALLARPSFPYH
jgi:hypothetical protein